MGLSFDLRMGGEERISGSTVATRSASVKDDDSASFADRVGAALVTRPDSVSTAFSSKAWSSESKTENTPSPEEGKLEVGDQVLIGSLQVPAVIKFVGRTCFAEGDWVGVALNDPCGKHDGSVKGLRYFECQPLHGLFVRPSAITKSRAKGAGGKYADEAQGRLGDKSALEGYSGATRSRSLPRACDDSESRNAALSRRSSRRCTESVWDMDFKAADKSRGIAASREERLEDTTPRRKEAAESVWGTHFRPSAATRATGSSGEERARKIAVPPAESRERCHDRRTTSTRRVRGIGTSKEERLDDVAPRRVETARSEWDALFRPSASAEGSSSCEEEQLRSAAISKVTLDEYPQRRHLKPSGRSRSTGAAEFVQDVDFWRSEEAGGICSNEGEHTRCISMLRAGCHERLQEIHLSPPQRARGTGSLEASSHMRATSSRASRNARDMGSGEEAQSHGPDLSLADSGTLASYLPESPSRRMRGSGPATEERHWNFAARRAHSAEPTSGVHLRQSGRARSVSSDEEIHRASPHRSEGTATRGHAKSLDSRCESGRRSRSTATHSPSCSDEFETRTKLPSGEVAQDARLDLSMASWGDNGRHGTSRPYETRDLMSTLPVSPHWDKYLQQESIAHPRPRESVWTTCPKRCEREAGTRTTECCFSQATPRQASRVERTLSSPVAESPSSRRSASPQSRMERTLSNPEAETGPSSRKSGSPQSRIGRASRNELCDVSLQINLQQPHVSHASSPLLRPLQGQGVQKVDAGDSHMISHCGEDNLAPRVGYPAGLEAAAGEASRPVHCMPKRDLASKTNDARILCRSQTSTCSPSDAQESMGRRDAACEPALEMPGPATTEVRSMETRLSERQVAISDQQHAGPRCEFSQDLGKTLTQQAAARRELSEAVEDHDIDSMRSALAKAADMGVSSEELHSAQRILSFEVQRSLLREVEGICEAVQRLAESVRVAEERAAETERTAAAAAAAAAAATAAVAAHGGLGHSPDVAAGVENSENSVPKGSDRSTERWFDESIWESLEAQLESLVREAVSRAVQDLSATGFPGSIAPELALRKSSQGSSLGTKRGSGFRAQRAGVGGEAPRRKLRQEKPLSPASMPRILATTLEAEKACENERVEVFGNVPSAVNPAPDSGDLIDGLILDQPLPVASPASGKDGQWYQASEDADSF